MFPSVSPSPPSSSGKMEGFFYSLHLLRTPIPSCPPRIRQCAAAQLANRGYPLHRPPLRPLACPFAHQPPPLGMGSSSASFPLSPDSTPAFPSQGEHATYFGATLHIQRCVGDPRPHQLGQEILEVLHRCPSQTRTTAPVAHSGHKPCSSSRHTPSICAETHGYHRRFGPS